MLLHGSEDVEGVLIRGQLSPDQTRGVGVLPQQTHFDVRASINRICKLAFQRRSHLVRLDREAPHVAISQR